MEQLTGRLTGDAKVSEVKGGKTVVNFSIAINDSYKPKDGERVAQTTYVDCAYWLNAKIGQYLKKGLLVQLLGRMGSRAWINRDGDPQSSLTCTIRDLKFLGKSPANSTGGTRTNTVPVEIGKPGDDDDLPF